MSSIFADQGTAAHRVLEECLTNIHMFGLDDHARNYIGRTIEVSDTDHASLSPSSADRWMICPGSIAFIEKHEKETAGTQPRKIIFEETDAIAVQKCLEYVKERKEVLRDEYGPVTLRTEHKVNPAAFLGTNECQGTSDITLVCDGYIEHIDYKHGAGVPVDEKGPQNQIYLLGTCAEYTFDGARIPFAKGRCTIVQPRCEKVEPRIRWIDINDVHEWALKFSAVVRHAIKEVNAPEPELHASEKACRFCPVKGDCEVHVRFAMASAGLVDPDEPLPEGPTTLYGIAEDFAARDTRSLTPVRMRQILDAREILAGALQAVEAYAQQLLIDGTAPAEIARAYKLVRTQTRRRWDVDDEETLVKRLKSLRVQDPETEKKRSLKKTELFEEKLRSVAQIEKIFKTLGLGKTAWDAFHALVNKPEGGLVIAPASDPREPVKPKMTAQEAFGDTPVPGTLPLDEQTSQQEMAS